MPKKAGECLQFENCENFRELGGYKSNNGQTVKWGMFYRTPALGSITSEKDLTIFNKLGVKHIFDFRSETEQAQFPDPVFEGVQMHKIAATLTTDGKGLNFDLPSLVSGGANAVEELLEGVSDGYEVLPFNNPAYQKMFEIIKNNETPILFHCTAGKDRTGVAAALILILLGVSEQDVVEDYMATNKNRVSTVQKMVERFSKYLQHEKSEEFIRVLAGVEEKNIWRALNAIKKKYQNYDEYFLKEFGISQTIKEKIKQNYLEN